MREDEEQEVEREKREREREEGAQTSPQIPSFRVDVPRFPDFELLFVEASEPALGARSWMTLSRSAAAAACWRRREREERPVQLSVL